jgi:hypothetical protein
MPTVLRIGPYRFFFYLEIGMSRRTCTWNERRTAPSSGSIQWLADSGGLARPEIRRVEELVRENAATLRRAWDDYFTD